MNLVTDVQCADRELESFVIKTCGSRPPSHSDQHMKKVRNNSVKIYDKQKVKKKIIDTSITDPLYLLVITVAWLHDVADHKYIKKEPNVLDKLKEFLKSFLKEYYYLGRDTEYEYLFTPEKIIAITERISFSREKEHGDSDWFEVLGEKGIEVRDIVSDGDKLDAIGRDGIHRCRAFTVERAESDGQTLTDEQIKQSVVEHYHEKLKLLGTEYMRTDAGREMAVHLDREMLDEIEKL